MLFWIILGIIALIVIPILITGIIFLWPFILAIIICVIAWNIHPVLGIIAIIICFLGGKMIED